MNSLTKSIERSVVATKLMQKACLCLLAVSFWMSAFALDQALPNQANFGNELASEAVHHVADWVIDAKNNRGLPFLIVDKTEAKVFVFYPDGKLRGAASALLGLAKGDDSVPGIGSRSLASIQPEERTTPAGRFVAALDHNLHGEQILWVDYDNAISLHPVITSNQQEHRAERLASLSPLDKRISFGCINVSADFFKNVVSAALKGTNGIVYVLPETRSAQKQFGSYEVQSRGHLKAPSESKFSSLVR